MSRMLDILEIFLTFHAYTYLRLDGATPVQRRQVDLLHYIHVHVHVINLL